MNIGESMSEEDAEKLMMDAGIQNVDAEIQYKDFVKTLFKELWSTIKESIIGFLFIWA